MADPLRLGPWRHYPGVGWSRTFTHCEVDGAQTTATEWRLWPPVEYPTLPLASGPETGLEGRHRADTAALALGWELEGTASPLPDALRLADLVLAFGRVNRVTRHPDGVRPESDAEHTLMLAFLALTLSVLHPESFDVVVAYEAAALAKNPAMHLIGGRKGQPIAATVAAWRARNRHATIEGVLRKACQRGCQITHVAQGELLTPADPPRRHYLVAQLQRALAVGVTDPNVYAQLQQSLDVAGLRVASEQARDAHALARIAERRPAPAPVAPVEHPQLFGEVA